MSSRNSTTVRNLLLAGKSHTSPKYKTSTDDLKRTTTVHFKISTNRSNTVSNTVQSVTISIPDGMIGFYDVWTKFE